MKNEIIPEDENTLSDMIERSDAEVPSQEAGGTCPFQEAKGCVRRCVHTLITIVSSEWLLTQTSLPNGGDVIILRSFFTSLILWAATLAFRNWLDPDRNWNFSFSELQRQFIGTAPWFGGVFAAVYAALYARFAAQWTYLANLYNQIKSNEWSHFDRSIKPSTNLALVEWKAGFVEDAEDLHLAAKPLFAAVIKAWVEENPTLKDCFIKHAPGGEPRFEFLMKRVHAACEERANRGT